MQEKGYINFKSFTVCTVFRNVSNLWFVSFSGCGKLYVADGNWKLRYAHCMWKVPVTVSGFGDVNYPTICPLSPDRGHAFCKSHCIMAKAAGYPSELRPFLQKCGVQDIHLFTGIVICY